MTAATGPGRVAVFRALQLGDLLCVIPAIRALRSAWPDSRLTLVGLPWAQVITRRFARYFDDFLAFPGFPGMPEQSGDAGELSDFLQEAATRGFDLVLQMHGSGTWSNPLAMAMGARALAGFFRAGDPCPEGRFLQWRDDEPETERYLRLVRLLGARATDGALEFPVDVADFAEMRRIAPRLEPRRYVCLHPGSQLPSRRWPPERFAMVGDTLAEAGQAIVLTGTAGEATLTDHVRRRMRAPALDLAGRTSLGAVAALIDRASLLVCNDTGVSHLAAARGTPSVVVSCGGDARRWAPADTRRHRMIWEPAPCRPCAFEHCPVGHPCATAVHAATVAAAALEAIACARATDWQEVRRSCVV